MMNFAGDQVIHNTSIIVLFFHVYFNYRQFWYCMVVLIFIIIMEFCLFLFCNL